jgi:hypothetical protein
MIVANSSVIVEIIGKRRGGGKTRFISLSFLR